MFMKVGRICGVCGDIGQIEKLIACCVCKTACEHTHSAQVPAPNPQGVWYCQTCRTKPPKMTEKKKFDEAGLTRRFENSKVKFLSSEVVKSLSSGTARRFIKSTTNSDVSSMQTALPSEVPTPTPTQANKKRSASAERLLSVNKILFQPGSASGSEVESASKMMLLGEAERASGSGSKESGHKLSCLNRRLPYRPASIAWKGSLEVHERAGTTLVELVAYLPLQVSAKLFTVIHALPKKLKMKMVPRFNAWPKQFETESANFEDIGVCFLPSDKRFRLKCSHLLRQLDCRKLALKMNVSARLQLVVYSSQMLEENSPSTFMRCTAITLRIVTYRHYFQSRGGTGENLFFWGFFWKRKLRCGKKKQKFTPERTPSKTSLELGAHSDFETQIAKDKRAEMLTKEMVEDIFDVTPGFTMPPFGHVNSQMDKLSETSMPGKETRLVDQGVSARFSQSSYKVNQGSGSTHIFSSIGLDVLETAMHSKASDTIDAALEQRAEEAESERAVQQLNTPPGITRNLGGSETVSDPMSQQLNTSPGFGTSGSKVIKHKKEALVRLPVGLEIPHGFSRREEPRDEHDFSGKSQCSRLAMNQVLNAQSSVPNNFMGGSFLGNQQTPIGQRQVLFNCLMIEETPSEVCNKEPTSLSGNHGDTSVSGYEGTSYQIGIPEASPNHSQSIQVVTSHSHKNSEQGKIISSVETVPGTMPQQLNTPPGFATSGSIVIKHKKEPVVPVPVGLEIPPGFSRRVEPRDENGFCNKSQCSRLPMNEGGRQQQTPIGQQRVLFNCPLIQGTPSESCNTQPITPGGNHHDTSASLFEGTLQKIAIPETSPYQSQSIQAATRYSRNYSEHSKSISSMFASGEKQRRQSSLGKCLYVVPIKQETSLREVCPEMGDKEDPKNLENSQVTIEKQRTNNFGNEANLMPQFINGITSMSDYIKPKQEKVTPYEIFPLNKEGPVRQGNESDQGRGPFSGFHQQSKSYQDASAIQMVAQNQNENHCLFAGALHANVPVMNRAPPHFRVLNQSFLASCSRDVYNPSVNKETAGISDMTRGEGSNQRMENGRLSQWRRSRSPVLRQRSRSRSPVPRRHRSPSRSSRRRYRSPVSRRYKRQSRSYYRSPIHRRHTNQVRSPVDALDLYQDLEQHHSQYRSRYRYRSRSRSRSLSLPPSR